MTLVPVQQSNRLIGAIEIAESLRIRDGYLRANAWNTALATLTMVFTSGVVVLVLGVWMVGRPLQQLAIKAWRVGEGDFSGRIELKQRDEIGQLATEFNAMCDRIVEANLRTEAETSARIGAMEQLRHADRLITVGRLAAGIAHELGTPLNVIMGRIKMLKREKLDPQATEMYLHEVESQAQSMTTIIRQLLDFARRREPKVMAVELCMLARTIARLVEPLAAKKGIRILISPTESVLAVGDAMQLEQVLSNLVVNAIHACPLGGEVVISCWTCDSKLGGADPMATDCVFLRVKDNGHGMTPEILERIFEPFFTTKDVGQGTGLGLSVAHGIIGDHHGRIAVTSSPGTGSTFTVYLPRARL